MGEFDGLEEFPDGMQIWTKNDRLHREDGPAVTYPDGTRAWYKNGRLHREDGPAVENPDGEYDWYLNGALHRLDGPARCYSNTYQWWVFGEQISEKEFLSKEFYVRLVEKA